MNQSTSIRTVGCLAQEVAALRSQAIRWLHTDNQFCSDLVSEDTVEHVTNLQVLRLAATFLLIFAAIFSAATSLPLAFLFLILAAPFIRSIAREDKEKGGAA